MANRNTRKQILEGHLRFEGSTLITMTARNARERAYAPYSGFKVGAAIFARIPVETSSGRPDYQSFGGCNVENAAFDSSECAATGALMAARAAGAGKDNIIACYVVGTTRPCAGCLQKLAEFSPVNDPIMIYGGCGEESDIKNWLPLTALLPNQFPDPANAAAITRTPIAVPPGRVALTAPGQRRSELIHNHGKLAGLVAAARDAQWHGYAPYSEFLVRAIVLTHIRSDPMAPWMTFTGSNIENAVHGSTVCAERVALCNALSNGVHPCDILACAIIGPTYQPIAMCGECRQFFSEFSPPEDPIMIFCGNYLGKGQWSPFKDVLPRQFP